MLASTSVNVGERSLATHARRPVRLRPTSVPGPAASQVTGAMASLRVESAPTTAAAADRSLRVDGQTVCAICFRETATETIVLAIHGRQDPSRWQRRTQELWSSCGERAADWLTEVSRRRR